MEKNTVLTQLDAQLILIVEDEIPVAELLAEWMTELGYRSLVAYNGQQALSLARKQWPTLVITDQMMPLMTGIDLIRALSCEATNKETCPPPTILISASVAIDLKGVYVDAVLLKPFDLEELERVVQLLWRQAPSRESHHIPPNLAASA